MDSAPNKANRKVEKLPNQTKMRRIGKINFIFRILFLTNEKADPMRKQSIKGHFANKLSRKDGFTKKKSVIPNEITMQIGQKTAIIPKIFVE